jgi:hypothetical protein
MKNLLCIISNSLTLVFAIIAMVMINQVDLNQNGNTMSDIDRMEYDVLTPLSVVLGSSILIIVICTLVKHKLIMNLLVILLGIIMFAGSVTLMVRVEKHDILDIKYNESQVKAMKVMLYLTASFGLLTGLICSFKGAYKLNKIVNKKH